MTTDTLQAAREQLTQVLAQMGWSYCRAMCRFAWQLSWNANRDPLPAALESLTESQVRHLTALLQTNVLEART